ILSAGFAFFIMQKLINYGLVQYWSFVMSALARTKGPGAKGDPNYWGSKDELTAVAFIGGNSLASLVFQLGSVEEAVNLTYTALEELIKNQDRATLGRIKSIKKRYRITLIKDGKLCKEEVGKLFTLLYKTEAKAGVTLWDLGQLNDPIYTPRELSFNTPEDERFAIREGEHYRQNERQSIIAGWELREWITHMTAPRGSSIDTAISMCRIGRGFRAKGIGEQVIFDLMHNQYGDFTNPGKAPTLANAASSVEVQQRKKLARLLANISGGRANVVWNRTAFACKAGTGHGIMSSMDGHDILRVKSIVIIDRNASIGDIGDIEHSDEKKKKLTDESFMGDIRRIRTNPDLLVIVPKRGTTNVMMFIGDVNRLSEEGHGSYIQAFLDRVGPGWGTMQKMEFWAGLTALFDQHVLKTTLAPDRLGKEDERYRTTPAQRLFGYHHFPLMPPHQSEDYVSALLGEYMSGALGRTPQYGFGTGFWHKLREYKIFRELIDALKRWTKGRFQTERDSVVTAVNFYGPMSLFERETTWHTGEHFLLTQWGLLNLFLIPILIYGNLTAFVGINLLYWTLGILFNQIETLHGLLVNLREAGFNENIGYIGLIAGIIIGWLKIAPIIVSGGPLLWTGLIAFHCGLLLYLVVGSIAGGGVFAGER
ncbi:MAG: hypothetical protein AAB267_07005, partial [Candidatus Desantisbacteria bacterium]